LGTVPINDPEAISVAIPLSATLVVPLELNTEATGEALTSLVMAEVKSQIPVPLSQVYVDWQVVNDDPEVGFVSDNSVNVVTPEVSDVALDLDPQEPKETKSKPTSLKKIICFVINKEIIQTYQTVLNNLGFEIEYFELEIYSVMRAAVPNDVKQALIVDIGARYTKLYVVENGKIVEAVKKLHGGQDYTAIIAQSLQIDTQKAEDLKRTLDLGSLKGTQLSTELELSINKVSDKIKQLMAEYKLSSSVPIYLSGGGSLLFGLPEYIANSLAVKVIICQPFINTSAPAYLDKLLVETGPEYAVSAGLALKHIRTI